MRFLLSDERVYVVAYDISDRRRWRRVFKAMKGFGSWLQLSVFQCRLSKRRYAEMETRLRELVKAGEDHVLVIDVLDFIGFGQKSRFGIVILQGLSMQKRG